MTETRLILPARAFDVLRTDVERVYPHEGCGLLVGDTDERRQVVRVARAEPTRNVEAERGSDRYLIDPHDQLRVERAARDEGLGVVGVYHSHPDAAPKPSQTDLDRAVELWGAAEATPSWLYVIVRVDVGIAGEVAVWRLVRGVFEAVSFEVVEGER